MSKQEFLNEVRARIAGLNEEDIRKALDFYAEAIDDRIEDGLTEEQAVAAVGTPDEISGKILMETPLPKLIKAEARTKPSKGIRAWEIILIVLGAPVWLPVLITVFALGLAVVVTIAALILAVIVTIAAAGIGGVGAVIASLLFIIRGGGMTGLIQLGAALILIGLVVLLFIPGKAAVLWMIELMGRFAGWVKYKFVSRRRGESTDTTYVQTPANIDTVNNEEDENA
ncbi:MAG: DUF1700 domain-containing protein [Lachnospiraceae bacterium]|nr:DUF1700 domain-containing protein [Lachnospiraceae bacterium]